MTAEHSRSDTASHSRVEKATRAVPKHLKLTSAQAAMLRNERDGLSLFHGLEGRSAHGGATGTMNSLLKRGLLRRSGGLTDDGRAALSLAEEASCRADADGRCTRCGLEYEDPAELTHDCPPGFK